MSHEHESKSYSIWRGRQERCVSNCFSLIIGYNLEPDQLCCGKVHLNRSCRSSELTFPRLLRNFMLFHTWGNARSKRNNIFTAYCDLHFWHRDLCTDGIWTRYKVDHTGTLLVFGFILQSFPNSRWYDCSSKGEEASRVCNIILAELHVIGHERYLSLCTQRRIYACTAENGRGWLVLLGDDWRFGYLSPDMPFHGSKKWKSGKTTKTKLPIYPLFFHVRSSSIPPNVFYTVVCGDGSHIFVVCDSAHNLQGVSIETCPAKGSAKSLASKLVTKERSSANSFS